MDAAWYELPASVLPPGTERPHAVAPADEQRGDRAARTRWRLLVAAAECFAARGYHPTSLRDVLEAAELTKGALYFHFGSKMDLARAVAAEAVQRWGVVLAEIDARDLDPLQTVLVQTDSALVRWNFDLVFHAARRTNSDLQAFDAQRVDWHAAWEVRTERLLDRAAEQGLLRPHVDRAELSRTVVALIVGHQRVWEMAALAPGPLRRMSASWGPLLRAEADPAWVERWERSGWAERALPELVAPADPGDPEPFVRGI